MIPDIGIWRCGAFSKLHRIVAVTEEHLSRGDTSAFVDHLRLIHSTLMIACLGALIAATSDSSVSATRAYDQASQLATIQAVWQTGWLRETVETQLKGMVDRKVLAKNSLSNRLFLVTRDEQKKVFDLPVGTNWYLASLSQQASSGETSSLTLQDIETRLPHMQSLDDVIYLWNTLNDHRYFVGREVVIGGWLFRPGGTAIELDINWDIDESNFTSQSGGITVLKPGFGLGGYFGATLISRTKLLAELRKGGPFQLAGVPIPPIYKIAAETIEADHDSTCYLAESAEAGIVVIQTDCQSELVILQAGLTAKMFPQPTLGAFAQSFADLDQRTTFLHGLSIEDLQKHLLSEKNRARQEFDFLGAKIPSETIARWGSVLLLGLAAYLYVIFNDFARRVTCGDPAWSKPWLGTSPMKLSGCVFAGTILFFAATILFLAFRGYQASGNDLSGMSYFLPSLGAIIVSAGIWYCRVVAMNKRDMRGPIPATPIDAPKHSC